MTEGPASHETPQSQVNLNSWSPPNTFYIKFYKMQTNLCHFMLTMFYSDRNCIGGLHGIGQGEEMKKGEIRKGHKETSECNRYVHYLNCGDTFRGVCDCPNA